MQPHDATAQTDGRAVNSARSRRVQAAPLTATCRELVSLCTILHRSLAPTEMVILSVNRVISRQRLDDAIWRIDA